LNKSKDEMSWSPLRLVAEFYRRVNRTIRSRPTIDLPDAEIRQIEELLEEEVDELRKALHDRNLVKIADGLGDVVYVVYGAALQFGIPLDDVVQAIHEANMTKPNSDGTVKRSSAGKILRGDAYVPPALEDKLKIDGLELACARPTVGRRHVG
jgi:predicted HAD superfamily Cof-like phosphohydrolase